MSKIDYLRLLKIGRFFFLIVYMPFDRAGKPCFYTKKVPVRDSIALKSIYA